MECEMVESTKSLIIPRPPLVCREERMACNNSDQDERVVQAS